MPKIGGMPPTGRKASPTDWKAVAQLLKENPGEHVLPDEFEDTDRVVSLANSINQGHVKLLNALGGEVKAFQRNTRPAYGGKRRGDLWVRWTPGKE